MFGEERLVGWMVGGSVYDGDHTSPINLANENLPVKIKRRSDGLGR